MRRFRDPVLAVWLAVVLVGVVLAGMIWWVGTSHPRSAVGSTVVPQWSPGDTDAKVVADSLASAAANGALTVGDVQAFHRWASSVAATSARAAAQSRARAPRTGTAQWLASVDRLGVVATRASTCAPGRVPAELAQVRAAIVDVMAAANYPHGRPAAGL